MNVGLKIKFSSVVMQGKRMSCERHTNLIFFPLRWPLSQSCGQMKRSVSPPSSAPRLLAVLRSLWSTESESETVLSSPSDGFGRQGANVAQDRGRPCVCRVVDEPGLVREPRSTGNRTGRTLPSFLFYFFLSFFLYIERYRTTLPPSPFLHVNSIRQQ